MARYKMKPVEVEAYQWNGWHNSEPGIRPYFSKSDSWTCPKCGGIDIVHGWVDTMRGGHVICPGDYIITNFGEEHMPCNPDLFSSSYDPIA